MSKYQSAVEDSSGRVHATESIIHISPACGVKIYIGTGRELHEVDCPECQRLVVESARAGVLAACTEQGFRVWWFDVSSDRYWVAAETQHAAYRHLRSQPVGRPTVTEGDQVTDLDEINMAHGDPHDGEEPQPCSLRDLLRWKLDAGCAPPVIIAASDWLA